MKAFKNAFVVVLLIFKVVLLSTAQNYIQKTQVNIGEYELAEISSALGQRQNLLDSAGGLFDGGDALEEATLKLAIDVVNRDPFLLPYHHLTLKSETIRGGSFHAIKSSNA